ncbi:hypothetical protein A3I48_00385 [Candidatus Daviesbacteria bacterium RIFCSPLOWO2_02_FULL_36_7]|uniref:DUF218 domain-containing protein n=1 Tax=Candidatus Daviesbacteria bacterium RIFCSPLOWO2_02_FULL_36_7 TaxID=1797792 RepID=A0A1F5MHA6_9BACT|nr:MAG: hypothetical protein A3I48_00385 [Candidatus Daviesbacteria bacterium RIFCSPLOWO2_02_FULL_36_7]
MNDKAILVHGYWISKGVSLLSERQADAAARAYLAGEVDLILCPTGYGEWGQGHIGEFIKKRILERYPEISSAKIITFAGGAVNTKQELRIGLEFLRGKAFKRVLDLAPPFHNKRIKLIIFKIKNDFEIEFKTTFDYLRESERMELLNSALYKSCEKGEKFRLMIFQNRILDFLADLMPDQLKSMLEALSAKIAKF